MTCNRSERGFADMSKNRLVKLILLLVLSALVTTSCYRTPEQRAEYIVKRMSTDLKLNNAQTAQLEKIKDEFMARRPGMVKMREETVEESNDLMRSPEIDKAKLDALTEKNIAQAADMIRFISAKFLEIHDMLTPEQREKLVSNIEKYTNH